MTEEHLLELIVKSCNRHKTDKTTLTDFREHLRPIEMLVSCGCIECVYKGDRAVITLLKDKVEPLKFDTDKYKTEQERLKAEKKEITTMLELKIPEKYMMKTFKMTREKLEKYRWESVNRER